MTVPGDKIAVLAERGGVTAALGGSTWIWLAENQQAIAALCAILGAVIGAVGFAVHWWYLHRGHTAKYGRRRDDGTPHESPHP